MRSSFKFAAATAVAAIAVSAMAMPAFAECKKFGFLVNDYGKDGPTKDAKELLDKSIASQMAERGIKDYKIGAKTVKCELFLNFIVFDEHTCTAEATACWGGAALPKGQQASKSDDSDAEADKPKTASEEKPKKSKIKEASAKSSDDSTTIEPVSELSDGTAKSRAPKPAKAEAKTKTQVEAKAETETAEPKPEKVEAKAEKAEVKSEKTEAKSEKAEAKPEAKKTAAAKSHGSRDGVADPVKPRIASAASGSGSSVVTGSVNPPKKREPAKSLAKKEAPKDDESNGAYPTPQAPVDGQ